MAVFEAELTLLRDEREALSDEVDVLRETVTALQGEVAALEEAVDRKEREELVDRYESLLAVQSRAYRERIAELETVRGPVGGSIARLRSKFSDAVNRVFP